MRTSPTVSWSIWVAPAPSPPQKNLIMLQSRDVPHTLKTMTSIPFCMSQKTRTGLCPKLGPSGSRKYNPEAFAPMLHNSWHVLGAVTDLHVVGQHWLTTLGSATLGTIDFDRFLQPLETHCNIRILVGTWTRSLEGRELKRGFRSFMICYHLAFQLYVF